MNSDIDNLISVETCYLYEYKIGYDSIKVTKLDNNCSSSLGELSMTPDRKFSMVSTSTSKQDEFCAKIADFISNRCEVLNSLRNEALQDFRIFDRFWDSQHFSN